MNREKRIIIMPIFCIILIFCFFMMPLLVGAKTYKTTNLEESLKEENIEYDLKDYKETDDQVIIYLFRGKGCKVCRSFLTFLNSIIPEYGKYFKVVSYEIWKNDDNKELLNEVAEFTGVEADGVPYIVIGDEVFGGYYQGYDENIKNAIKKEYDKKNKYDIMVEMNKKSQNEVQDSNSNILWSLLFSILSTGIIIFYINNRCNKILNNIDVSSNKKKK